MLGPPVTTATRGVGARIALAFVGVFLMLGIQVPYFPVWLQSRGLSPEQIGVIASLGPWMRVVANPLVGRWADRSGRIRMIATVLGIGVVLSYVGFWRAETFFAFVIFGAWLGATHSPLVPLTDSLAVRAAGRGEIDYGSIRRWGSVAFIVATLAGGYLLEGRSDAFILWALLASAAFIVVTAQLLPHRVVDASPVPSSAPRALLRRRDFAMFIATVFALHGCHAVLYGFASTHWRAAGVDDGTIGWLWTIGVVAEIGLFTWAPSILRRVTPATLLAIAGVGGAIRWPVLAVATSVPVLFAVQLLHAATFAAMHLGAMEFIKSTVEPRSTSRATAAYSATSGVALGLGLPWAGALYASFHGGAYWAMGGVSAVGAVLALVLGRLGGGDGVERASSR